VVAGYRHPLPRNHRLSDLISAGWHADPDMRPTAREMAEKIEEIIRTTVDDMKIVPEVCVYVAVYDFVS
jgi:hypothetical protein